MTKTFFINLDSVPSEALKRSQNQPLLNTPLPDLYAGEVANIKVEFIKNDGSHYHLTNGNVIKIAVGSTRKGPSSGFYTIKDDNHQSVFAYDAKADDIRKELETWGYGDVAVHGRDGTYNITFLNINAVSGSLTVDVSELQPACGPSVLYTGTGSYGVVIRPNVYAYTEGNLNLQNSPPYIGFTGSLNLRTREAQQAVGQQSVPVLFEVKLDDQIVLQKEGTLRNDLITDFIHQFDPVDLPNLVTYADLHALSASFENRVLTSRYNVDSASFNSNINSRVLTSTYVVDSASFNSNINSRVLNSNYTVNSSSWNNSITTLTNASASLSSRVTITEAAATTSSIGRIQIATVNEVLSGSNNTKAVTPFALANTYIPRSGGVAYDSTGLASVDFEQRRLLDANGGIVGLWDGDLTLVAQQPNSIATFGINSAGLSMTEFNVNLDSNASGITIGYTGPTSIGDGYSSDSANFSARSLLAGGVDVINWNIQQMADFDAINSINWSSRDLFDSSGVSAANWAGRYLYDNNGQISVDWLTRNLSNVSGSVWKVSGSPIVVESRYNADSGSFNSNIGSRVLNSIYTTNSSSWNSSITTLTNASASLSRYNVDSGSFNTNIGSRLLTSVYTTDSSSFASRITALSGDVSVTSLALTSNGTAAAPSFDWSADPDTGIYRIGDNNIGISTGGTLRVDISNTRLALSQNTASTSTTTGTLVVTGGAGVSGAVWAGSIGVGNSGGANMQLDGTNRIISTDGGGPILFRRAGNFTALELSDNTGNNYSRWSADATRRHIWSNNGGGTIYAQINSAGDFQTLLGRVVKTDVITTNTTLDASRHIVVCNSTTGFTVTLPAASSNSGREYTIKNKNTGTITLDATSTGLIDGLATQSILQWSALKVVSDGTTWNII